MPNAPRALWKGAIGFGLVHVPVSLHSAVESNRPKMRMVVEDTGAAVGYQKIDTSTGAVLENDRITKGVEVSSGQFVTLSKDEIAKALPRSTQLIEIETFVKLEEVPPLYIEKPYFTSPQGRAGKVYALLRNVLQRTGRAGIGRVVLNSKQHLAMVLPQGKALAVCLLRWQEDMRSEEGLPLPDAATEAAVTERDLQLGEQLVLELAGPWKPEQYADDFKAKLAALVEAKRERGEVLQVEQPYELKPTAEVVDLTELLRRSLTVKATPEVQVPESGATPAPERRARTNRPRVAANDSASRARAAAAQIEGAVARAAAPTTPRKQLKKPAA